MRSTIEVTRLGNTLQEPPRRPYRVSVELGICFACAPNLWACSCVSFALVYMLILLNSSFYLWGALEPQTLYGYP